MDETTLPESENSEDAKMGIIERCPVDQKVNESVDLTGQEITPQLENLPRTFDALIANEKLLACVLGLGFSVPTPIQSEAIPLAMQGKDLLLEASTGSGKTIAFAIPLAARLLEGNTNGGISALILSPTRELAVQISKVLISLHPDLEPALLIGGEPQDRQVAALQSKPFAVVGTPGRVLDLLRQKAFRLNSCNYFVLDEADEMLSMGFIDDIRTILSRLPEKRQGLFVSATITPRVRMLAGSFLTKPQIISIPRDGESKPEIEHLYINVGAELMDKPSAVCDIIETQRPRSAIIFCNTKSDTTLLESLLRRRGFDARRLNSDLTQSQRNKVMQKIRSGELQLLVATDVAARGIDIEQIDLVINFSVHEQSETYIHRTGRTGRAGRRGRAISLVGPRDFTDFHRLQKLVDIEFSAIPRPSDEEVGTARLAHLYEVVKNESPKVSERDRVVARLLLKELGDFGEESAPPSEELEIFTAKLARLALEHHIRHEAKSLEDELQEKPLEQEASRPREQPKPPFEKREPRRDPSPRPKFPDNKPNERNERSERSGAQEPRSPRDRDSQQRPPRQDSPRPARDERPPRYDNKQTQRETPAELRVYIGQGEADGISKDELANLAVEFAELKANDILHIRLRDHYAYVDLIENNARTLVAALNGIEYNGSPLPVEIATEIKSSRPLDDDRPRRFSGEERRPQRDRGRGRHFNQR